MRDERDGDESFGDDDAFSIHLIRVGEHEAHPHPVRLELNGWVQNAASSPLWAKTPANHYNPYDPGSGILNCPHSHNNSGSTMATTPSKDHKRRERELKKMYKRQAREEAKVAKKAAAELEAAEAIQKAADEKKALADAEFEAAFAAELEAEAKAEAAKKATE